MSQKTDNQDLLGRTYEYCIQQFAEKEGVSGGEFYTPASVVKALISIYFFLKSRLFYLKEL